MNIKAIETQYKGYRFRSRLEARWAVCLDTLGADWQYEPEGFVLDQRPYLPDFFVRAKGIYAKPYPQGVPSVSGLYLEIKPVRLTSEEEKLCSLLALHTGHCVYAAAGNLGMGEFIAYKWHPAHHDTKYQEEGLDECGWNILLSYLTFQCAPSVGNMIEQAIRAVKAGRSARFEHGESPIIPGEYSFL